ncbi:MAG: GNAT family N-acetyltransferase [Candidatus Eisenbacteria sp.]|nr:GNAT family N-acetyltransferase [Candidatus Eisenbacteria bacterium]
MIRRAAIQDAREIAEIHVQTWRAAYAGLVPETHLSALSMGKGTARWQDALSKSTDGTLAAEVDGRIVGWISFGKSRDDDGRMAGEVYAVYVRPVFWGKGFGRKLMESAEAHLWAHGHERITLWVLEGNQRSRVFYSRAGYALDGTRKPLSIGGKPLWELRYVKIAEHACRGHTFACR